MDQSHVLINSCAVCLYVQVAGSHQPCLTLGTQEHRAGTLDSAGEVVVQPDGGPGRREVVRLECS